jgi:hypothetical protein
MKRRRCGLSGALSVRSLTVTTLAATIISRARRAASSRNRATHRMKATRRGTLGWLGLLKGLRSCDTGSYLVSRDKVSYR